MTKPAFVTMVFGALFGACALGRSGDDDDGDDAYVEEREAEDVGGGAYAPEGWFCFAQYYGTRDGCDCDCGVRDPDCDDPAQAVLSCGAGETCGGDGACVSDGTAGGWDDGSSSQDACSACSDACRGIPGCSCCAECDVPCWY